MGCSSFNTNLDKYIKNFNQLLLKNDDKNIEIDINTDYCQLYNIGQKGFELFCHLSLHNIEYLYLNKNKISDIKYFENFTAPKLIKLELSSNFIEKIDVFEKVNYPLESLDLSNNKIKDISVFEKESTLPKLRILLLNKNKFDFNDEKIKNIWSKIDKKMKNNKKEDSSSDEDDKDKDNEESLEILLRSIKTLNNRFKTDFCIYDNNLIKRIEKMKISPEERNKIIKEIKLARTPTIKNNKTIILEEEEEITSDINTIKILHSKTIKYDNNHLNNEENTINDQE